jgi:hypothetical protein
LLVVQDLIATALDAFRPGPVRVISMCAGQGHDILGVARRDVKTTVEFLPALCAHGAQVIWTRGPRDDGMLDRIRAWFDDAGFSTEAVVVGEGGLFGVGTARFEGAPRSLDRGVRLFEFLR